MTFGVIRPPQANPRSFRIEISRVGCASMVQRTLRFGLVSLSTQHANMPHTCQHQIHCRWLCWDCTLIVCVRVYVCVCRISETAPCSIYINWKVDSAGVCTWKEGGAGGSFSGNGKKSLCREGKKSISKQTMQPSRGFAAM
jgi:hypothetical protein